MNGFESDDSIRSLETPCSQKAHSLPSPSTTLNSPTTIGLGNVHPMSCISTTENKVDGPLDSDAADAPKHQCPTCQQRFKGKPKNAASNLKRHLQGVCNKNRPKLTCSEPECGKLFTREDNRRKHANLKHSTVIHGRINKL